MSHINVMLHAGGWLEGGLVCSFEKFILDAEILQMLAAVIEPFDTGVDELGLDAIREVGPGGHYFGARHTLERYEHAFYAPLLSDWRNFESWRDDGSKTATERANGALGAVARDGLVPRREAVWPSCAQHAREPAAIAAQGLSRYSNQRQA